MISNKFALLAIVGAAALPFAAGAQEAATPVTSTNDSQIVVRDAATGALRAATPEEAQALHAKAAVARRVAPSVTLSRVHSSGARGARLTDEFMSYSVLVRQPDGSVREVCFDSREQADAAVRNGTPVAKTAALPTE